MLKARENVSFSPSVRGHCGREAKSQKSPSICPCSSSAARTALRRVPQGSGWEGVSHPYERTPRPRRCCRTRSAALDVDRK
eukprot:scaffold326613_cov130-Tisochrysis_lutea.AAC.1